MSAAPAAAAPSRGGGNNLLPSKRQDSILELSKFMDQAVRVKCLGGRQVKGILRGYDDLVNLVLEECEEYIRDPDDHQKITNTTRKLGLIVVRGTQVSLVAPDDGMEEIENPFLAAEDDGEE
mmetsp:Transcript_4759/g.11857  ORF Transcript_4759/g.11857 Transcript_4759/m.11857 type:complete len:122 (+) Transcript_4759:1-366(+)